MNSIMERWIGSCRRELLDRTLIWNQRHLMIVLREYEDFYNAHRPHRALTQAAPLRPLPDGIADLDHFRVLRRDRARRSDSRVSPGGMGFRHPQARARGGHARPCSRQEYRFEVELDADLPGDREPAAADPTADAPAATRTPPPRPPN
jgi:hypothetical protein